MIRIQNIAKTGLIRPMGPIRLMGLIGLLGLMGLMGCSSDDYEEVQAPVTESGVPVTLTSYVSAYTDFKAKEANRAGDYMTRSWTPPTGYHTPSTDEIKSIGVFFTSDAGGGKCDLHRFWYGTDNKWRVEGDEIDEGTFNMYGYLPYTAGTASLSLNAAPNNTYAKGAVMTLSGLSGVMSKDLCVLVGAKEGTDADTPASPGLKTGKFSCQLKKGGEGFENYIFLLFDHLYAAINFNFTINATYYGLRTIKLKRLELIAYTDNSFTTKMKKEQSTTVTLLATDDESSPIVSVSDLTPNNSSGDMEPVILFNDEDHPLELSATAQTLTAYVPEVASFYILKSVYDVYDKNPTDEHPEGNLIRKNCEAENKLNPRNMFNQPKLERGKMYNINLMVNPTYLYVLSEPDLNNPTVEVE